MEAEDQVQDLFIEIMDKNLSVQRLNVCKLVYLEKKKYKEAAVEMGITINSVKTHLKLANKALREELTDAKEYMMSVLYA